MTAMMRPSVSDRPVTGGQASVLAAVETASATLESARRRIDDLNVFPVPDGDTGTNMARTVQALAAGLAGSGRPTRRGRPRRRRARR